MKYPAVTTEQVYAPDVAPSGPPLLDEPGRDIAPCRQPLHLSEELVVGLREAHPRFLGGHPRHVARLLAEQQLRRRLPLPEREISQHRQHGGGHAHGAEDERADGGPPRDPAGAHLRRYFSASSAVIICSVSRYAPSPMWL